VVFEGHLDEALYAVRELGAAQELGVEFAFEGIVLLILGVVLEVFRELP
jgi:hypothetical protein